MKREILARASDRRARAMSFSALLLKSCWRHCGCLLLRAECLCCSLNPGAPLCWREMIPRSCAHTHKHTHTSTHNRAIEGRDSESAFPLGTMTQFIWNCIRSGVLHQSASHLVLLATYTHENMLQHMCGLRGRRGNQRHERPCAILNISQAGFAKSSA